MKTRSFSFMLLILLIVITRMPATGAFAETASSPQQQLSMYLNALNNELERFGESPVNSVFEQYSSIAVFGITDAPDSSIPEDVEFTFYLQEGRITKLVLRVSDSNRFVNIAASAIAALSEDKAEVNVKKKPQSVLEKVRKNPATSFEDPVTDLPAESTCVYFAYFPNQYRDKVDWLQMTVIFPITGFCGGSVAYLNDQSSASLHDYDTDLSSDYDGYWSEDSYSHYEVFATASPEPDSAAAEQAEKILRTK